MATTRHRLTPLARIGAALLPDPRGFVLKKIMSLIEAGNLTLELPDGRRLRHEGGKPGPDAEITLHSWRPLKRLIRGGDLGFAEGYIAGEWSTPDLTALITLGAVNASALDPAFSAVGPVRWAHRLWHMMHRNSRSGSKRNITYHYDLGNEFYRQWLDREMVYSSAIYERDGQTLEEAQTAKLDRIVDQLDLKGGESVLEIGCGWGGLARRLATAGAGRVTGLTLSPAQLELAEAKVEASGLAPKVDLRLQDYRDVKGSFDRIVSIEMFEAVGEAFWSTYFRTVRERLRPGGHAVLQIITIAEERFENYRRNTDFIQRYIFPGGMLPSKSALGDVIRQEGLALVQSETFGGSYARTLADWRERFQHAWPQIEILGYPQTFRRMWDYYLSYCEAGFQTGLIDVGLYTIKPEQ